MTLNRRRQPAADDEWHCDAWESKKSAEIPNARADVATTTTNQNTHREIRKQYKPNPNRHDRGRRGRTARKEGATPMTSPIDLQAIEGTQLEKSRKKKKTRTKHKHVEQLLGVPVNGSETG